MVSNLFVLIALSDDGSSYPVLASNSDDYLMDVGSMMSSGGIDFDVCRIAYVNGGDAEK